MRMRGREDAVYVLFLKEKNEKNFLWVLICGFDINRNNIPFGSLDICVLIKSLTEQRQKPYVCLLMKHKKYISICRDRRPRRSNVVSIKNCIFVYYQIRITDTKDIYVFCFRTVETPVPTNFGICLSFHHWTDVLRCPIRPRTTTWQADKFSSKTLWSPLHSNNRFLLQDRCAAFAVVPSAIL